MPMEWYIEWILDLPDKVPSNDSTCSAGHCEVLMDHGVIFDILKTVLLGFLESFAWSLGNIRIKKLYSLIFEKIFYLDR